MKIETTDIQTRRVRAATISLVVLVLLIPVVGNIIVSKFRTTGTWDVIGIVLFIAAVLWSLRLGTLLWSIRRR
jgi:cytochrome b561